MVQIRVASHQWSSGSGLNMLNNTKVFPAVSSGSTTCFTVQWVLGQKARPLLEYLDFSFLKSRFQVFSALSILTVSLNASISLGAQDSFSCLQTLSRLNLQLYCSSIQMVQNCVFLHLEKRTFPGLGDFLSLAASSFTNSLRPFPCFR